MIANLELSDYKEYNPFEYCFSFKEYDGQPINTAEQKDAAEYMQIIFGRFDDYLKKTTRKYLLKSIFGGQYSSQIICKGCGHIKNNY